jgi:hypothetical protein
MARNCGFTFTAHQIGRDRIAACAFSPSGRIILPDITIWNVNGGHHEIKHKAPTAKHKFGLEAYRFESLQTFARISGSPVYYTIHNWKNGLGRNSRFNRLQDWVTCDVTDLAANRSRPERDKSWVNGQIATVDILYWPVCCFRPLSSLWGVYNSTSWNDEGAAWQ